MLPVFVLTIVLIPRIHRRSCCVHSSVTLTRRSSAMTVADGAEKFDWSLVQKRIAGTRTVLFSYAAACVVHISSSGLWICAFQFGREKP